MEKEQQLIRIDSTDKEIGVVTKTEAHLKGILHRAFSVFIFNKKGEWLLQQRAFHKYHSAGLWSNTCCGHPVIGENTMEAAGIRLLFEMGLKAELKNIFDFTYRAELENGLIENEFDHVYFGISDDQPVLNKDEVTAWKYIPFSELDSEIKNNQENYTEWFKLIIKRVEKERLSFFATKAQRH